MVPYSMETNDARFWRGGLVSVGDFYEYLKGTFDCLYEEGETHPKMMSVGLHCRIAGRPARSRAVAAISGICEESRAGLVPTQDRHRQMVVDPLWCRRIGGAAARGIALVRAG